MNQNHNKSFDDEITPKYITTNPTIIEPPIPIFDLFFNSFLTHV